MRGEEMSREEESDDCVCWTKLVARHPGISFIVSVNTVRNERRGEARGESGSGDE
jgi:hypothetical protein